MIKMMSLGCLFGVFTKYRLALPNHKFGLQQCLVNGKTE